MSISKITHQTSLSIDDISRDTGLGKDQLRVWERRYGFPVPVRDEQGNRRYSLRQLECLREVRRLMDQGQRPGQLLKPDLCQNMPKVNLPVAAESGDQEQADAWLQMEHQQLARLLRQKMESYSTRDLLKQVVEPLIQAVGERWAGGRLAIFEEHRVSQLLKTLLSHCLLQLDPDPNMPVVVFSTVPGERHQLGLLMAELTLRQQGCRTINLGPEMPLDELVTAAQAYHASFIALSFSINMNRRQVVNALESLLELCSETMTVIAGGRGVASLRRLPLGIKVVRHAGDLGKMFKQWKSA